MKCDWELFVVRTLSIISLDLKIFVSIKYMNEHVKRYTSARPLPLSDALGIPTF